MLHQCMDLHPGQLVRTATIKGGVFMHLKGWAITMGVGAAAGAVAILMMPKNNPTRRLAAKAANMVEDMAWKVSDKITQEFDM